MDWITMNLHNLQGPEDSRVYGTILGGMVRQGEGWIIQGKPY
jgi:hypothetical protein